MHILSSYVAGFRVGATAFIPLCLDMLAMHCTRTVWWEEAGGRTEVITVHPLAKILDLPLSNFAEGHQLCTKL